MNNTTHPKIHLTEPRPAQAEVKNPWSLTKTRPSVDAAQASAESNTSSQPKTRKLR
jgi:hypothetical protein